MPWPQTGATQYHALLGLPHKGRAIKGLVVCNYRYLKPLDLQNGLALGCYQPSPEVLCTYIDGNLKGCTYCLVCSCLFVFVHTLDAS